jgi:protease-4
MFDSIIKNLKNIFIVLMIIQFVPALIQSSKNLFTDYTGPAKARVGLIVVKGMISDATFYTKRIEAFLKDDEIKGLILRIDSPGGYAGCCDVVYNELKRFRTKKPIVAVIENIGASGSYYLAAAANTVIASPLSLVGSIGVYMELANVRQLLDSWHVQFKFVQSGKYKTVGSMVNDITPEGMAYLQKLSDDQYQSFVSTMAQARNINASEHTLWADGQIFTGQQALGLKLIDKLGSISDALEEIKQLAHITADIKVVQSKKKVGFVRSMLLGSDDDADTTVEAASSVASFAHQVVRQFSAQQSVSAMPATL